MSLLDSLLWGHELERVPSTLSPSSPSSPVGPLGEPKVKRPPWFWGSHDDYYGWRANVALDAIGEIPAPEGLIVWLREHSPFLHGMLTRDLPNKISRAWDAQIPCEDFDALCLDLVDTYRRAADLYRR